MPLLDLTVDVPGHGKVVMDIAYGGAFYAFVSAEKLGLDVSSAKTRDLVEAASTVTEAVKVQVSPSTANDKCLPGCLNTKDHIRKEIRHKRTQVFITLRIVYCLIHKHGTCEFSL